MSKINLIIHGLNHATAEFHRQEADNLRNTDRALVSKIGLIIPLEPGCLSQALMTSVLKSFGTEAMELVSIKTSAVVSADILELVAR